MVLSFFTTVIWFLVAISILVAIHEYGHFITARLCGVKVLRFSIGFGPRLLTFRDKHETEYALSAIPLGGYVKMLDERESDVEIPESERPFCFNRKSVGRRIAIAAAGPIANILLAFLLYWVYFLNGTTALSPVVGKIAPDSIAARAGLSQGQEILSVDGIETHSRRDVALALLNRLGESGEIVVTAAYGDSDDERLTYTSFLKINNWLKTAEEPDPLAGLGIAFFTPGSEPFVHDVQADSPAELAGLQAKDRFISISGHKIQTGEDWIAIVEQNPERSLDIVVERDSQLVDLTLTPSVHITPAGKRIGRAGIMIRREAFPQSMIRRQSYSVFGAAYTAIHETQEAIGFVFLSLKKLLVNEISVKNLSGPIGIAQVAADQAKYGVLAFISFLAHVSVVLAVLNILPIPVLDGGHILFYLVEWVKGSPVSERMQMASVKAGMAVLLCVMVVAFYNDILRL